MCTRVTAGRRSNRRTEFIILTKSKKNINYCAENGMMLGIGIGSTVCYNSPSDYRQDTPGWLFLQSTAQKATTLKIGNNYLKIPYYNDAVFFLKKMQRFFWINLPKGLTATKKYCLR
ncbi:MAG: hypothetical protein L6V93_16985 [Clostridiales bacterium]|nr:MAG: hypothetical protein L6V93_16985 [Clostridiales bacterium]